MYTNLHPDEALRLVLETASSIEAQIGTEMVQIGEAQGRILAQDLCASIDHPPFAKAAMDGYAYVKGPSREHYTVVDALPAGSSSARTLAEGELIRIMTGAPLPEGATGVQRIEWTRGSGTGADGLPRVVFTVREKADNIIERGENKKKGSPLMSRRVLKAQDIGILAADGVASVEVRRRPRVGIISTGDEIVEAGRPLPPAKIYDSNGPQLAAMARAAGAEVQWFGIVGDNETALTDALGRALERCTLVILSGGVSMGDYDLVPRVVETLGVEPVFHTLKMRPGKPTFFGRTAHTAVFGLPGNPVSTFVNFEVLVKPFLFACMGLAYRPLMLRVCLAKPLARTGSDRVEFLPGIIYPGPQGMLAEPLPYRGSSMITVLADAQVLFRMELGQEKIDAGEYTNVRLIRT